MPIALTVIQLVVLLFYKLDKEYPSILADLQARQCVDKGEQQELS